jgi:hypothetical protein
MTFGGVQRPYAICICHWHAEAFASPASGPLGPRDASSGSAAHETPIQGQVPRNLAPPTPKFSDKVAS